MENCKYCHSDRVVPVLDEGIEQRPPGGNKHRRRCLTCERWLPMCSAKAFRTHPDPHVLPVDGIEVIPLSASETAERYPVSDLPERVTDRGESDEESPAEPPDEPDTERRTELRIECVLELTTAGHLDESAANEYLAGELDEDR